MTPSSPRPPTAVERIDALARRAQGARVDDSVEPNADVIARFRDAMDDDFGSPAAMAVIFDAVSAANQALDDGDRDARQCPRRGGRSSWSATVGLHGRGAGIG